MKIQTLHIFDFDGTLVDSSHRYRVKENGKIDLEYWIENAHKVLSDIPLPMMSFATSLPGGHSGVIATARLWCTLTKVFCKRHNINLPVIARKGREDCRPGAALKIAGIKRLLNLKQYREVKELHIYEDNADYLNALMLGFPGYICRAHFIPSNQGY